MKKSAPYFAVPDDAKSNYSLMQEEFKSEVSDPLVKFPKELGVEHPFEFEDVEKTYKKVGIVSGAINKIVDNILGEFNINCKDNKVLTLIKQFIKDTNMQVVLREWILEATSKGNGFLEIDFKNSKLKVINANDMYVVRDKKGNVKGYNQFLGQSFKNFSLESRNVISFQPNQIAHLMINKIANEAYGYGLIMPNERTIENIILGDVDKHKLLSRKAGAPIHVKVGQPGEVVDNSVTQNISNDLKFMTNRTEWVTNADVEMKVLEFGEIGKNLSDAISQDIEMFSFGMQIPAVLLGVANVPEGLAKVQMEAFNRMISSIQEDIETIIETKILKPYLISNKLDGEVEFIWNLPGEEEINLRLTQLNTMLSNPFISDGMRKQMQIEIGRLLHFEDVEELVDTPNTQGMTADKQMDNPEVPGKEELKEDKERKKEEAVSQPEIPGEKNVKQEVTSEIECCHKITEGEMNLMSVKEFVNLVEMPGFNYSDYMIRILKRLRIDKFDDLRAITEKDLSDGLLGEDQIEKLRIILKDGFRKNRSISEIESEIKSTLNLKDRIKEDGTVLQAEYRPNLISRTETIRLANLGLIDTYKENNVKKVRWLSAYSERTCSQCEGLNGQVFDIDSTPLPTRDTHPSCRCSLLSVEG